jgi:sugar phosphate isomerase/epimerase
LRSILRAGELDFSSLRLDLGGKGLGPGADIDAALDRIETMLQAAAGFQCPLVCVELGPLPAEKSDSGNLNAALSELGRRADRHGVAIAFGSELAGFATLDRALRDTPCPWFGIDLDPVAMLRDEWTSTEIFSRLGPLIRHVRGRDAVGGADRRTKPVVVGHGSVDWRQLLSNLDSAAYHGWITLDPLELPNRRAAAAAGAAALRGYNL